MHKPDDVWVDDTIVDQIRSEFELVARVAVIETNYATREYVGQVRWEILRWVVGVASAAGVFGVGLAGLLLRNW